MGQSKKGTTIFPINFTSPCYIVTNCPIGSSTYTSKISCNTLKAESAFLYLFGETTDYLYYTALGV